MAMQEKAWMMGHLFKSWIGRFVKNVRECGLGIFPSCRHLLILDDHGSHVTMDVVKTARSVELDVTYIYLHIHHMPCNHWMYHASSPSSKLSAYCKMYGCYRTSLKERRRKFWQSGCLQPYRRHYLRRISKVVFAPLGFFLSIPTPWMRRWVLLNSTERSLCMGTFRLLI
jgi:hypothetical protein